MRTIYPDQGPKHPSHHESEVNVHKSAPPKWYSTDYLASIWAKRPARILAALGFVAILTVLILAFAAGSESSLFTGTDFSSAPKVGVHVNAGGQVVLNPASSSLLRWAPPALSNPTTITLTLGDDDLNLDNSKDYILKYPSSRKNGHLFINGGRNIVIIGGAGTIPPHSGILERNVRIRDAAGTVPGRVVHIEGIDIDASGGGEADAIGIDAPNSIIQIENVRVTGLIGHLSSTHADVIQTYGGMKELRVYNLTGASHYNNLYLRRENSPLGAAEGIVTLDHVNMFGYINPSGWDIPSTLRAISIGTQPPDSSCDSKGHCGPANPDDPINCQLSNPVILSNFYGDPPQGTLQRFMWPTDYMTAAGCASVLSSDGKSADWPSLRASNGGLVTGVLQLGPPPGGDFVPAGVAGLSYVSPGYQ